MTIDDLLKECERAEAWAAKTGSIMRPAFNVKIMRRCKGNRARVLPGLYATLVQWADGDEPVCVGVVYCDEARRAIERLREDK